MNRALASLAAASLFAAAASFVGCSSHPEDASGSTSESLSVLVHLPHAIGGVDRYTNFALHTTPAKIYPVGLTPSSPQDTGGALQAESLPAAVPTTFDLSANAPVPGNQGQTGSCAAWATGYSSMGWWANKAGLAGAPYAPMFLYAQEVRGSCETGTSIEGNMSILQKQGIDTTADYEPMQKNLDCATQPSAAQIANAAHYKITGYQQLNFSGGVRNAVEQMISAGYPVVLGIMAYTELMNANASNYLVGPPAANSTLYGGHAIAAFKYDENGVWILNSWTDQWGNRGWAELSWSFIEGTHNGQANVMDAAAILGVVGGGSPGGGGGTDGGTPTPPPSNGPKVSFVSPAANSTLAPGANMSIAVAATDSVAIASASLDWKSPSGHATYALSSLGNGQWGVSLTLSAQAVAGSRTLTVTVKDANGSSASTAENVVVQ